MGRGLSPEQLTILWRASQPPEPGTPSAVDLLARDAIEVCYPGLQYQRSPDGKTSCSAGVFQQSPELLRARASISRSFRRLEQRGLAERFEASVSRWAGIKLTDEGRRTAALLSPPDDPFAPAATARRLQYRDARRQEVAEAEALIASFHREQDQQITPDNVRDTSDLGDNVPGVAEPPNIVRDLPSEGQDFKADNIRVEPCGAELPDSPLTPSDNLTNASDSVLPQGGGVDPLQPESIAIAPNGKKRTRSSPLADRFPKTQQGLDALLAAIEAAGSMVNYGETLGVSKQSVSGYLKNIRNALAAAE